MQGLLQRLGKTLMVSVSEELRAQARWCADFGSPFTSQLLERAADDLDAGGVVARLIAEWSGNPTADAVSLRLAGALHAATLSGRADELASIYPAAKPGWSMDEVWPAASAYLERDADWVRAFMQSPPQTNETARSTALTSAFLWLAGRMPTPFHMLELGASAGLNLNWDRFSYAYPVWARGERAGPLITTSVSGPAPEWSDIEVASRAGCDQNPMSPADRNDRLRLRSYIWADQTARLARLDSAINLASELGTHVEKADAAEWITRRLAGELPEGTTVVYHSLFLQYPAKDVQLAIGTAIEAAGARVTEGRRLAWVRMEPETILGGPADATRYVLDVVRWDPLGRARIVLAKADPHGRTLEWLRG